MEMRGRNGKWFWAGSGGTIREIRVVVVFEFSPWIGECRDHGSVRSENSDRSRGRSINGEKGAGL